MQPALAFSGFAALLALTGDTGAIAATQVADAIKG